jgi:acetyl-CoA/propionyl-CoA/long-chain acyl-CoA carboxylase, biotin carboxylase, biotin carboxyl carrier protein
VAAGGPLGVTQEEFRVAGHAIECRVNAEDPARGFLPTPGRIAALRWPGGPGIRVDAGYQAGDTVSQFYDDLLGKVIAWGRDRDQALARMRAALADLRVEGVASTAPALLQVLDHHDFRAGAHWTTWLEEAVDLGGMPASASMPAAPASEPDFTVTVDGRRWPVRLHRQRPSSLGRRPDAGASAVVSPLAGTLTRVEVATGQRVEEGALLAVVEAMKMETPVLAPFAGTIMEVRSLTGGSVTAGETIVVIDPGGSG